MMVSLIEQLSNLETLTMMLTVYKPKLEFLVW